MEEKAGLSPKGVEALLDIIDQQMEEVGGQLRNVRERISALKEDAATKERLLLKLKKMRDDATGLGGGGPERGEGVSGRPAHAAPLVRLGVRKNSASALLLNLAVEVIRTEGRPLTRKEIIDTLKAKGQLPPSENITSLMSKVLGSNKDIFERTGNGYRVKTDQFMGQDLDTAA